MAYTHRVFVTGGTGYVGKRLIPLLHEEGHEVVALVREQSRAKLPWNCTPAIGDALNGDTYARFVEGCDTFVQLVGVAHPSPRKAAQFREIDLRAGLEAVRIARAVGIGHFVYVSVAHPAPMMQAYITVRAECETAIVASGMSATVLQPWYVLGPGHLWPYCLLPFYKVAELVPKTRDGALRLGLVSIQEMVRALVNTVNEPAQGVRYIGVPEIRRLGRRSTKPAKNLALS
jgi:uncharacterized protein YbjT (DUF2867 family)